MAEFDPNDANVDDVLKKLEKADETERQRILNLERAGKGRKSVLEEYGIDPDVRVDGAGRALYPWEVAPEDEVRPVKAEESAEQRKRREAQAEFNAKVEAAAPSADEQQGGTAAGVGATAAPATGGGAGGATAAPTAGGPGATGV